MCRCVIDSKWRPENQKWQTKQTCGLVYTSWVIIVSCDTQESGPHQHVNGRKWHLQEGLYDAAAEPHITVAV